MIMHFSLKPFPQMGPYRKNAAAYGRMAVKAGRAAIKVRDVLRERRKNRSKSDKPHKRRPQSSRKFTPSVVQSSGDGISKSSASLYHKPSKSLRLGRKLSPVDIYRTNTTGIINAGFGKQGTGGDDGLLNTKQIRDIYEKSINTTALYDGAAAQSTTAIDKHFYLESQTNTLTLTNQSPNTVKAIIWTLVVKRDRGGTTAGDFKPKTLWGEGLTQNAGVNWTEETNDYPGSSPMKSKIFKQGFRVVKRVEVEMHSGANHQHTFHFGIHKKMDMELIDGFASDHTWSQMKGLTNFTMVTINGMLCDSSSTFTGGVVTLDQAKVIWREAISFTTRVISIKSKHIDYRTLGVLPTTMTAAYNQNPDGQGVVDTVANVSNVVAAFG